MHQTLSEGLQKWLDIFRIARISCVSQPPVYGLENLDGEAIDDIDYEEELCQIDQILQTKGRGKTKKHLVSWRGYPAKFNTWILASELVYV